MRELDTQALELVAPALGVGNPATATQPAVLDDANLQQSLEVGPLVRRARAPGGFQGGVYMWQLTQSHAGVGSLTNDIDFYDPGSFAAASSGYPAEKQIRGLDCYLAGPITGGTNAPANISRVSVRLEFPAVWNCGLDDLGQIDLPILENDGTVIAGANHLVWLGQGSANSWCAYPPILRLPNPGALEMLSTVTAAADITLRGLVLIVPKGMVPERPFW